MNDIVLETQNRKILASSRESAEKFAKNHDKVCRDIRNLLKFQPTKLAIEFIESEYISDRGRTYTEFLMTRNGFSLLCMGFTGEKALEWKLKYIDAFNKMEEELKSGNYLSEEEKLKLQLFSKDPLEVASAHNKLVKLEVNKATASLKAENEVLKPKADYHDEVLNKDGLITTTVIAKDLGFKSAVKLNQILNSNHIIFKNQDGTWCPYADYEWLITENYADYQSYDVNNAIPCLKWTEKGRKWIVKNYNHWMNNLK